MEFDSDSELVRSLASGQAEQAIETIIRTHGAMVMGACRRVLDDPHLAEDAFQATFLVLVRKRRSLTLRRSLGAWLHGVAVRTAHKAKAMRNRRQATGKLSEAELHSGQRDPMEEVAWSELGSLLDAEIQRLPEKLRSVIVLCELEGATHQQAAQHLGIPLGTVSSRALRAKEKLKGRLARRGVTISSAGLTAALTSRVASATVSPGLLSATVKLATRTLAGKTAAAGATAVTLADAVIKAMSQAKALIVAGALAAVLCVGVCVAAFVNYGADGGPQPVDPFLQADRALMHLGEQAFRHREGASRVAYLPGGNQLVTISWSTISSLGSGSGGVFLWDMATGRKLRTLSTAVKSAEVPICLAVSPSGNLFAVGHHGGAVKVWDATTTQVEEILAPTVQPVVTIAFSPSGRELITGSVGGKVHIFNVEDFSLRRELVVPVTEDRYGRTREPVVTAVAASPDGRQIAAGDAHTGAIFVFDVGSVEQVTSIESAHGLGNQYNPSVNRLAFSADGNELLSSGYRMTRREKTTITLSSVKNVQLLEVRRWDAATGELIDDLVDVDVWGLGSAAFAPDGPRFVTADIDAVRLWKIGDGQPQLTIPVPGLSSSKPAPDVAYSPDGSTLAVPTGKGMTFWDAKSGEMRWHNRQPNYASIRNVAWSPDGSQAAICYSHSDLEIRNAETGRVKLQLPMSVSGETYQWPPGAMDAAFSRDGRLVVAVGNRHLAGRFGGGGIIKSWDAVQGRELRRITVERPILWMALTDDASIVAVGLSSGSHHDAELRVFDLATGELVSRVGGDRFPVELGGWNGFDTIRAMRIQPGSTKVFVACANGYCFRWDYKDYKMGRENIIGFFADGRTDRRRKGNAIMSAVFSPDCKQLITSGHSKIWVWDTEQGALQHVETLPIGNRWLELGISRDGRRLVGAEMAVISDNPGDDVIRIWDLPGFKLLLTLYPPDARATSFAFSPDNSKLLTGLDRSTVLIWDVR